MNAPHPTKTRLRHFEEVSRREIRWHHFVPPEAYSNVMTVQSDLVNCPAESTKDGT